MERGAQVEAGISKPWKLPRTTVETKHNDRIQFKYIEDIGSKINQKVNVFYLKLPRAKTQCAFQIRQLPEYLLILSAGAFICKVVS